MQAETLIGILVIVAVFAGIAWRYSVRRKRDRDDQQPPGGGGSGGGGGGNRHLPH